MVFFFIMIMMIEVTQVFARPFEERLAHIHTHRERERERETHTHTHTHTHTRGPLKRG